MKIPFDIKYREKIESGEYKVETRDGKPVRIICWDRSPKFGDGFDLTLCVLIPQDNGEAVYYYNHSGKSRLDRESYDLFLVTPELTEFEKAFDNLAESYHSDRNPDEIACCKEYAAELLSIARKQLQPEIDAEIEKAYENADEVQYRKGREEALKDLPRWKKDDSIEAEQYITVGKNGERFHYKGHSLLISDLTKLPGFKEDE